MANGVFDFITQNPIIIPIIIVVIVGLMQGGYLGRRIFDKFDKRRKITSWIALIFLFIIIVHAVGNIDRLSNQDEKTQLPSEIPPGFDEIYVLINDFVFSQGVFETVLIFFSIVLLIFGIKTNAKGFEKDFMRYSGFALMILMGAVMVFGYKPDANVVLVFSFYQLAIVFGFMFLGGAGKLIERIKL